MKENLFFITAICTADVKSVPAYCQSFSTPMTEEALAAQARKRKMKSPVPILRDIDEDLGLEAHSFRSTQIKVKVRVGQLNKAALRFFQYFLVLN